MYIAHGPVPFLWRVYNAFEFGVVLSIFPFMRVASMGVEHGGVVAFGGLCVVDESAVGL